MATIALYASQINQMSGAISEMKQSVRQYKDSLFALHTKTLNVERNICDLDDVMRSIQTSTQTQDEKVTRMETLERDVEAFVVEAKRADSDATDAIQQNKADFYDAYEYLKPDSEKSDWENFWDDAGTWCKENWKKVLITAVIVIGAVLAIAAVICSGGMALAPLLASGLTALGMASGTAMIVATGVSLFVAGIALTSTLASSTLNIIDTWCDMSGNPTFKSWQTAMNWTSAISNGFYSVGSIFNAFKGISNSALREYGKSFFTTKGFASAILNANKYPFSVQPNSATFWTGMSNSGGETVAKTYVQQYGGQTLETTLESQHFLPPTEMIGWREASSAFALNASGKIRVLIGPAARSGSVWNTAERILLGVNPAVTSLTQISGGISTVIPRVFQPGMFAGGVSTGIEALESLFNLFGGDNNDET